jgi:flagellar hook-associated protein 3 FlgL
MRITNSVLVNNLKNNLSRNIRLLGKIQLQLETGRRISKPSIDPTGIVESLRLTTRLKENEQYRNNVADALGWLNTTDDALGALNSVIQRIYELTVQGANGPLDVEERNSICEEVKQLKDEMGEIANTTHGDRYIFGGTNTTENLIQLIQMVLGSITPKVLGMK